MANTLFLRLEGPLQSWGERARWEPRDSGPEPTKSGVVGLLACALGQNTDLELQYISRNIRIGVRCDRPGTALTDFQTIEGSVSANGQVTGDKTVISPRDYLCDASFLVAVHAGMPSFTEEMAEAVQRPIWPVFLGRKSCPPSHPLFAGLGDFSSLEEALASRSWPARSPHGPATMTVRAVIECSLGEGTRRRDEIISRSRRTFAPRYTKDVSLTVPVQPEEEVCISRD
jgi:CRISPR system Cascade subunit CasD